MERPAYLHHSTLFGGCVCKSEHTGSLPELPREVTWSWIGPDELPPFPAGG